MIKKTLLLFLVLVCASCAKENTHPDPISDLQKNKKDLLEQNAILWKNKVLSFQDKKDWQALTAITPLAADFKDTPVWRDPNFVARWREWLQKKSVLSWSRGERGANIWKLAEGKHPTRPSVGLKREQNGSWWIVFVGPENDEKTKSTNLGWPCENTCIVTIKTNGIEKTLTMRAPLHQEWRRVYTLGAPLPREILGARNQMWEVEFPFDDGEGAEENTFSFDMSNMEEVCRVYFGSCENQQ